MQRQAVFVETNKNNSKNNNGKKERGSRGGGYKKAIGAICSAITPTRLILSYSLSSLAKGY